jgi:hypothetical protein
MYSIVCVSLSYDTRNVFSLFSVKYMGSCPLNRKWHLRMNRRGSPPIYLNVELDPMRKRSTITHEAAVRTGESYEPFCMLFSNILIILLY